MLFLYDLPNWLLGVTIVGFIVSASYAGYFLFHRLFPAQFSDDHKGLAMSVLGVVATVNSLLLAFSAVSVWDAYQDADAAVMEEANTVGALARDLAVFATPNAAEARAALRQYAEVVVSDEWQSMQRGQASQKAWDQFDDLFRTVATLETGTTRQETWMQEIFLRTNELLKQRRTRLYSAQSEVPGTLWVVVLIGTTLCMLTTYVLPPTRFHAAMIGALALSIGLVFYFIAAMDRPFAGKESISPAPFQSALENMERWDANSGD
jgi:hypothetical protein